VEVEFVGFSAPVTSGAWPAQLVDSGPGQTKQKTYPCARLHLTPRRECLFQ